MNNSIKVLIVDDHDVVRVGLANVLQNEADINIVGEARDGFEACNKALELKPDVILMDVFMPGCNGMEAMMKIQEQLPSAKVVILTVSEREDVLLEVLKFKVLAGYLLKSASITEIAKAVRMAATGEVVLSQQMATRLVAQYRDKPGNAPALSARETEILQLLSEGLTNTEIGNRLFISESTVRTYLRRLLTKLNLNNRSEAIAYAARHYLVNRTI